MKYLLLREDIPLGKLLVQRKANKSVNFAFYGLGVGIDDLEATQGFDDFTSGPDVYAGTFCQILAIIDEPALNTHLVGVQATIVSMSISGASASVIEAAERDSIKAAVESAKAQFKVAHPLVIS